MSLKLEIFEHDAARRLALEFAPVLQGPPGPEGGSSFVRIAAAPLSALTVVWESAAGQVHALDYRDADHIDLLAGISITAASAVGQTVNVQLAGPLDVAGLGLTPGRVWLGVGGALTQTPPADGFDVLVGRVVAGHRLYLSFNDNIHLED